MSVSKRKLGRESFAATERDGTFTIESSPTKYQSSLHKTEFRFYTHTGGHLCVKCGQVLGMPTTSEGPSTPRSVSLGDLRALSDREGRL